MPTGVEITNTSGTYQIRGGIGTPSLMASGSVSTTTNTSVTQFGSYASITYTKHGASMPAPMCAVRPTAGVFLLTQIISGNTVTWIFVSSSGAGAVIPYWIFDFPQEVANVGLQIFEEGTGKLLYASSRYPMRMVAPISSNISEGLGTENFTFVGGRLYAALYARPSVYGRWVRFGAANNFAFATYRTTVWGINDGLACQNFMNSRSTATTTNPNYSQEYVLNQRLIVPVDVTNY